MRFLAAVLVSLFLLACGPRPTAARVSVGKAGDGSGEINSPSGLLVCGPVCVTSVSSGFEMTLEAVPDPGSSFEGWFDGCTGTGRRCTFVVSADAHVNALFRAKFSPISVTLAGTGEGRVVSDPPGIDCGSTCTASFRDAIPVTLQPSSSVDSYFSHWSGGGCSTGTCRVSPEDAPTIQAHFTRL